MPLPQDEAKPSTKHHQVDARFALLLEEDFGIGAGVILDALEGELQRQTITLCAWAAEHTEDAAHALRCRAWRRGRGAYRVPSVARDGTRSNTPDDGRASGRTWRDESLRGVLVDPARLNALADRLGV